jgi:hypothetical protein
MELIVIFHCQTCRHFNRQYLGSEGYEFQEEETESLTEAFDLHVSKGHDVEIELVNGHNSSKR